MGRKLTSWERAQRESERERERVKKAQAVEARRKKARAEKDTKIKKDIAGAEKAVEQYDAFYKSITSLHLHKIGKTNFGSDFQKDLEFVSNIKKPIDPGEFEFDEKKKLQDLKKESQYDFTSYCKAEGQSTFFLLVILLGTKKKHQEYLIQRKKQYESLKVKEKEREKKEESEHINLVSKYQDDVKNYDKKLSDQKTKFVKDEELRKSWFNKVLNGDQQEQEEASELMFPIEYEVDDELFCHSKMLVIFYYTCFL